MKQLKKINPKEIFQDRLFIVAIAGLSILSLAFFIYTLTTAQRSDLLLFNRYTGFGALHYYRARWSYAYNWTLFSVLVFLMHSFFAFVAISNKRRFLAFGCLIAGILVIISAWLNLSHIIALPR